MKKKQTGAEKSQLFRDRKKEGLIKVFIPEKLKKKLFKIIDILMEVE